MPISYDVSQGPGHRAALQSWRRRLCGHLFSATPAVAAPIIVSMFVIVAALDILSPRYLTFGAFYLIIVVYTTWAIGRWAGWLSAAAVTAVALFSDGFGGYVALAPDHAHAVAVVWSLAMRLLSFAAIIELVRGFRHSFEHARRLSETDALTGLLDRRAFRSAAIKRLARNHADGRGSLVIYTDLDGFKQVNDRLGHAAGDAVLTGFATLLRDAVAPDGLVCRAGGDEFIACLDLPDEALARQTVLGLRRELNDGLAALGYGALSCSLGATSVRQSDEAPDIDALIAQADGLMYRAKQARFVQLAASTA